LREATRFSKPLNTGKGAAVGDPATVRISPVGITPSLTGR
jgi:hypothetical protein